MILTVIFAKRLQRSTLLESWILIHLSIAFLERLLSQLASLLALNVLFATRFSRQNVLGLVNKRSGHLIIDYTILRHTMFLLLREGKVNYYSKIKYFKLLVVLSDTISFLNSSSNIKFKLKSTICNNWDFIEKRRSTRLAEQEMTLEPYVVSFCVNTVVPK